jgi:hypothetical protein
MAGFSQGKRHCDDTSTWWAGRPGAEPHIDGVMVYPNLIVAALFLLLTGVAYRLSGTGRSVEEDA